MIKQLNARVTTKKDTQANWESANPILLDGEEILVVCSDGATRRKVGDGSSKYSLLPFADYGLVPKERTINGKSLSEDIVLTADDIGLNDEIDVEKILFYGFPYSTKTFSDDWTIITSVNSNGLTLIKTFSDDFLACMSVLKDSKENILGYMIKEFSDDRHVINVTISTDSRELEQYINESINSALGGNY